MIFDDATSEVYDVQLVEEESTVTVMAALKRVVESRGLFCSLYSDRGSHMAWTPKAGGSVDRDHPTQIARALKQLGIELILAYSPQARGRCERIFGTWQGRLPQELRLRGITTVEAANEFLRNDWIAMHDASFSVKAEQTGTAFLPYTGTELEKIFSQQSTASSTTTTRCDTTIAAYRSRSRLSASAWRDVACWSVSIWTKPSRCTTAIMCWAGMTWRASHWRFPSNTNSLVRTSARRTCEPMPGGTGRLKKEKRTKKERRRQPDGNCAKPCWVSHISTGTAAVNLKQQNRTDHLLQKPDIFICYRQRSRRFGIKSTTWGEASYAQAPCQLLVSSQSSPYVRSSSHFNFTLAQNNAEEFAKCPIQKIFGSYRRLREYHSVFMPVSHLNLFHSITIPFISIATPCPANGPFGAPVVYGILSVLTSLRLWKADRFASSLFKEKCSNPYSSTPDYQASNGRRAAKQPQPRGPPGSRDTHPIARSCPRG